MAERDRSGPGSAERECVHRRTLSRGLREISRLDGVDGRVLFRLCETYGLPPELTLEELGIELEWREEFARAAESHRQRSRSA